MSAPLSLREARTKRQKANVYKTSRSEFRSTLNTNQEAGPSHQEDNNAKKRKLMMDDKTGQEAEEDGGAPVCGIGDEEKTIPVEVGDQDGGLLLLEGAVISDSPDSESETASFNDEAGEYSPTDNNVKKKDDDDNDSPKEDDKKSDPESDSYDSDYDRFGANTDTNFSENSDDRSM